MTTINVNYFYHIPSASDVVAGDVYQGTQDRNEVDLDFFPVAGSVYTDLTGLIFGNIQGIDTSTFGNQGNLNSIKLTAAQFSSLLYTNCNVYLADGGAITFDYPVMSASGNYYPAIYMSSSDTSIDVTGDTNIFEVWKIVCGAGNDTVKGGAGTNLLYGGSGNDTFFAGTGAGYITCGNGTNVVNGGSSLDFILCGTGSTTISGSTGNETIVGNGGPIFFAGGSGNDTIQLNVTSPATLRQSFAGGGGTNAIQILSDSNSGVIDLSADTLAGFQSLTVNVPNVVEVTGGQLSGITTLKGHFQVSGKTSIILSGVVLGASQGDFQITLDPAGGMVDASGAVLTSGQNVDLIGGSSGNSTITGSSGGNIITVFGNGNVVHGGASTNIVTVNTVNGIFDTSSVFDGGTGVSTINILATSVDLADGHVSNFQSINTNGAIVNLTAAQLTAFTNLENAGLHLTDGGTVSMRGLSGQNVSFTLANADTTIDFRGFATSSLSVTCGAGNDTVYIGTNSTANLLQGGSGNDTFVMNGGQNTVAGGTGTTTLVYGGDQAQYTLEELSGGLDTLAGPGGGSVQFPDRLTGIHRLQFADMLVDLAAATVTWTGDTNAFQLASGQTLDLSNATTNGDTVNGNNGTINLTNADVAASGNSQIITSSSDNARIMSSGGSDVINIGGSNGVVTVGGNGQGAAVTDTVNAAKATGLAVAELDGSRVDISGDGVAVTVGNSDNLGLLGTAETVTVTGAGDNLWVGGNGQGAAATDAVSELSTGQSVAALTVTGLDNSRLDVAGDGINVVLGSADNLGILGNSDVVSVSGDGDNIWIGGNGQGAAATDAVRVSAPAGQSVTGLTVTGLDNSRLDFAGSGIDAILGNADNLGIVGTAALVSVTGSGDNIWIGGNGQGAAVTDAVRVNAAAGQSVTGLTVTGLDNSRLDIAGDGIIATLGKSDNLGIVGTAETVTVTGSGDNIWIGGNGQGAAVTDAVRVSTAAGQSVTGVTVTGLDNSRLDVAGNGFNVVIGNNDNLGITGSAETVTATGTGNQIWIGGNGTAAATADAITLQNAGIVNVLDASRVNVAGTAVAVAMGKGDVVGLLGTGDAIAFSQIIGQTTLADFATSDQVTLEKSSFGNVAQGFNYWAYLLGHATTSAGDTTITIDATDSIVLKGVTLTSANQSQFHFT